MVFYSCSGDLGLERSLCKCLQELRTLMLITPDTCAHEIPVQPCKPLNDDDLKPPNHLLTRLLETLVNSRCQFHTLFRKQIPCQSVSSMPAVVSFQASLPALARSIQPLRDLSGDMGLSATREDARSAMLKNVGRGCVDEKGRSQHCILNV